MILFLYLSTLSSDKIFSLIWGGRLGRQASYLQVDTIKRESSIVLCIPNIEHGLHVWCGHSDQAANYSVSWPIPAPPACPAETWPNDATLDVSTDSF